MAKKDRPAQLGFSSTTTLVTSLPTFPALGFGRVFHWFVSVRFRDSNRSDGYFSQSCSISFLSFPVSSCYSVLHTWPCDRYPGFYLFISKEKKKRPFALLISGCLFVCLKRLLPHLAAHHIPPWKEKTFATQRLRNSRVTACRPSPLKSYRISARLKGYVSFLFQMCLAVILLVPGTGSKIFPTTSYLAFFSLTCSIQHCESSMSKQGRPWRQYLFLNLATRGAGGVFFL